MYKLVELWHDILVFYGKIREGGVFGANTSWCKCGRLMLRCGTFQVIQVGATIVEGRWIWMEDDWVSTMSCVLRVKPWTGWVFLRVSWNKRKGAYGKLTNNSTIVGTWVVCDTSLDICV